MIQGLVFRRSSTAIVGFYPITAEDGNCKKQFLVLEYSYQAVLVVSPLSPFTFIVVDSLAFFTCIMMNDTGLPVMNKPVNMMEAGPNGNNLQAQAMQRHPIDELQRRQGTLHFSVFLLD